MLTTRRVLSYLNDIGVLSASDVVDRGLQVADLSRRNQTLRVTSGDIAVVLKHGTTRDQRDAIAREAMVYRAFAPPDAASDAQLSSMFPRYYAFDERTGTLVLDDIHNARTLHDLHNQRGRFPRVHAESVGAVLGTLHRLPVVSALPAMRMASPPWVLSIHRPEVASLQAASSAAIQIIELIQQLPNVEAALDVLRMNWQQIAPTHGDFRWENILIGTTGNQAISRAVTIIDWEFAGIGDPAWDVGCFLADYVDCWLASIPVPNAEQPAELIDLAGYAIEDMQPAMRAFWHAYSRAAELDGAASVDRQVNIVRYCSARLIQRAFEHMQNQSRMANLAILRLQVAENMLMRPSEASEFILGFHQDSGAI